MAASKSYIRYNVHVLEPLSPILGKVRSHPWLGESEAGGHKMSRRRCIDNQDIVCKNLFVK